MCSSYLHSVFTGLAAVALIFVAFPELHAQPTATGVPFLTIPASVESHSLGRISALPLGSALAIRNNPATTGLQAFDVLAQGALYLPSTDWLPGFGSPITFSSQGGQVGFRLSQDEESRWAVGVGYSRISFDLGSFASTLNSPTILSTFHGWEEAHAISAGLAYDGPVLIGTGLALTLTRSNLAPFGTALESSGGPENVTSLTFGATTQVPVTRLLGVEHPVAGVIPFATMTAALVLSDVGGSVTYRDQQQSDPLPRALTLGLSASIGVRGDLGGMNLRFVEVELMREAQDILVERTVPSGFGWRYQSIPGDLRPFADLFRQSGNTVVEHRKGFRLTFAESFTVSEGSFVDDGYEFIRTSGLGFSSRVLFLAIRPMMSNGSVLAWVFENVSLQFAQASYSAPRGHPLNGTDFQSITVTFHATKTHAAF